MYLFFDTETTGLPGSWKAPLSDLNNWPRLVQLAFLVFDKDGNELENGDFIIKPEGFTIPRVATKIHGISTQKAINEGHPLSEVLQHFYSILQKTDLLIAHNMSFDEKIMGAEFLRKDMENLIQSKPKFCTMRQSTHFCAIPGMYGYKWPTLAELHRKLFKKDFDLAHNAAVDIEITAKCFWELKKLNKI
jgi:DNA polymerase III epsilon subunit-like protein